MGCRDIDYEPRSLGVLQRRMSMLHAPHVKKLTQYVENLQGRLGESFYVPYFDPLDGGVNAKILFLFEKPGPKADCSGFISRNNDDQTAENTYRFMQAAGIDRKDTCLWNVIPAWDEKRLKFSSEDLQVGIDSLATLIPIFGKLQVIVLVGRTAQRASIFIKHRFPEITVCESFHPSPLAWKKHPKIAAEWTEAYKKALQNNGKNKTLLKYKKSKDSYDTGTDKQVRLR